MTVETKTEIPEEKRVSLVSRNLAALSAAMEMERQAASRHADVVCEIMDIMHSLVATGATPTVALSTATQIYFFNTETGRATLAEQLENLVDSGIDVHVHGML